MKKYYPIIVIAAFFVWLSFKSIPLETFTSIISCVVIAVICTALTHGFYRVTGNGLRVRMIWFFGTSAFRYWVLGANLYLNFKNIYWLDIELVRMITLTPIAIAGIYLYFYILKINFVK